MKENIVEIAKGNFGMIYDHLTDGVYYLKYDENLTNSTGANCERIQLSPQVWKKEMVNCATAYYLNAWLCYDLGSRKNLIQYIDSYSGSAKAGYEGASVESDKQRLYYLREKYLAVISAMKLKEEIDGFPYYDLIYSLRSVSNKLVEYTPSEKPSSDLYKTAWMTPVALELLKWMDEKKFQFLDLLFYNAAFKKSHRNKHFNKKVKEAYADYFQAIKQLKETGNPKEYVLGAFLLQQYEPIFEHMIAACLSICREDFPSDINMKALRKATFPWWNCEIIHVQYADEKANTKGKLYFKTAGDYVNLMKAAWASFSSLSDSEILNKNHYIKKVLLNDMLKAHFEANENKQRDHLDARTDYPVKYYNPFESDVQARSVLFELSHPKWTDEDYVAIRDFLRNKYPIIENHISFQLGDPMKWSDSVIENIRDYYDPLFDGFFGFVRCEIAKQDGYDECPKCHKPTKLTKDGSTPAGAQRYICEKCGKTYTPNQKKKQYSESTKAMARKMLKEGKSVRKIAKELGCSKSSVSKWKRDA